MSLAARLKLKKLAALQEASTAAAIAREQVAEAARQKRDSRLKQIFDQANPVLPETPATAVPGGSPAARMKQEKLARLTIERDGNAGLAPERSREGEGASEYELLLASLGEDEASLKAISSTERKEEAKRHLIEKYSPHVDATLAAAIETGTGVQDEIVAMMLIWRFDIGDWDRGLDIAEHMLRHGLRLPSIKNSCARPPPSSAKMPLKQVCALPAPTRIWTLRSCSAPPSSPPIMICPIRCAPKWPRPSPCI